MTNNGVGAPEGNDNAVTHGLYEDKEKMFDRLDNDERRFVVDLATDLLDKFPDESEIGAYERATVRNLALDVLKRERANDYIINNSLMADDSESSDRVAQKYSRIVRDTTKEMEKMGLIEQGPAMKQAENTGNWMEQLEEVQDDSDE